MNRTETDDEDDALLVRAGRGDAAAFTRLVERRQARLMALATRMTGARATAEDLVQEAFTRAWRDAARFRPRDGGDAGRGGAGAWLSRIVVNLAIDQARRPRPSALDLVPEPADPAPRADAALISAERAAQVRAAVAALPERQRAAIGLAYDGGLSNAAGAAALQTTVGAYELLLVRARRSLRAALADDPSDRVLPSPSLP